MAQVEQHHRPPPPERSPPRHITQERASGDGGDAAPCAPGGSTTGTPPEVPAPGRAAGSPTGRVRARQRDDRVVPERCTTYCTPLLVLDNIILHRSYNKIIKLYPHGICVKIIHCYL